MRIHIVATATATATATAAALLASLLSGCVNTHPVTPRIDMLGMPVIDESAVLSSRTIAITPDTRWVNVNSGDTVRFVAGQRTFAWSFEASPNVAMFDLNQVAPAGVLTRPVPVDVAPNPRAGSGG